MKLLELLDLAIEWEVVEEDSTFYQTYLGEKKYLLRLNDFPEEPLYTLLSNCQSLDIEDKPVSWILPDIM